MDFLPAVEGFDSDLASKRLWGLLQSRIEYLDGYAFYQHPLIRSASGFIPDLVIVARGYQPIALRCFPVRLEEIASVDDVAWTIQGAAIDAPPQQVADFAFSLSYRFTLQRALRNRISAVGALAFPNIARCDFEERFGRLEVPTVWSDESTDVLFNPCQLDDIQWRSALSVFQSATPLCRPFAPTPENATTMGGAIQILEQQIALLDKEQLKVATQLPAGPQQVRGLAGTGKTVLLAMKAANAHHRYPDKKILVAFYTQSLYSQVLRLITDFYKIYAEESPNWENLHVRHSWGSAGKPGVYSELCQRQGFPALNFREAKALDPASPFGRCCAHALGRQIDPFYDYVLIDEAQDFPKEFFPLVYRLTREPHAIYWAFDELQTLSSVEMPTAEGLFGHDEQGKPLVSLDGEHPGGIEKDLVLQKSYRCPQKVLMLAHALGLGLYSRSGCVQMIQKESSWRSIGYEVEKGPLEPGNQVVLFRPEEHSPNPIERVYQGSEPLVHFQQFKDVQEQLEWVADRIAHNIQHEQVRPEHIIVTTLNPIRAKEELPRLQVLLSLQNVKSLIPGIIDDSSSFAEPGSVTLTSVFRVKGNEAPVIYVLDAHLLAAYSQDIEARNKAFTCISRAKGWVRICAVGLWATNVGEEIAEVLKHYPRFQFVFPSESTRHLYAERTRRKKQVQKVNRSIKEIISADAAALSETDEDQLRELHKRLEEALRGSR